LVRLALGGLGLGLLLNLLSSKRLFLHLKRPQLCL